MSPDRDAPLARILLRKVRDGPGRKKSVIETESRNHRTVHHAIDRDAPLAHILRIDDVGKSIRFVHKVDVGRRGGVRSFAQGRGR